MPVDDVAESDSLVPVFPEIIPAYCAVPGFRRTGISPGPLIHPTAGICRDFVTFTCTYRILSGECALSRRRSASLQRCLRFGSFVRVAGTPLTGNVKL